jgi:hypothetical protein
VRRLLYAVLSVAAAVLGTTALSIQPAAASTWTDGYCPTSKGVTVVVDFTAFQGDVQTRCYPNASSSTTGVTALQKTGFNPVGTANDQLQFICRLEGLPTNDDDNCRNTPPASAYWSYWYAPNNGTWTYSQVGAAGHHVILGGFEGWRFGDGSNPPAKSTTRPPPPVKPTFHMGPAASTKAAPKASSSTTARATKTASPTSTSTGPGLVLATPDGTSTSADSQAGGALPGGDPPDGPSPWPFVIGVVAIGLVGGGAGLVVYQRRRAGGI